MQDIYKIWICLDFFSSQKKKKKKKKIYNSFKNGKLRMNEGIAPVNWLFCEDLFFFFFNFKFFERINSLKHYKYFK